MRPWAELKTPWYRRAYFDVLSVFSPRRAAVAFHFDRMDRDPDYREATHLGMRMGGYAAARDGDNTTPWPSALGPRSADAEVLGDLTTLRDRARVTERDDPVGSGLILQFTQQMVGTGIVDRADTGDDDKNEAINAEWKELRKNLAPAERISWEELQRMLSDRMNADGEIWVKRSKDSASDPMFFEIVEGDRVDTPVDVTQALNDGHEVRSGVERSRSKIVAYWIARSHPGDTAVPTLYAGSFRPIIALSLKDYERVPVEDAKHLHRPGRPGQSRYVTMLHTVTQNLRDMDLLIEASQKRLQVAACFAVFIESADQTTDIVKATAKKFHYQMDQDLAPGMLYMLRAGEKVSTVNPNFPMPDLDVLVKILARRIGAAFGVSWRVVLADLGDANFSAARADRIEFEQSAAVPRQSLIGTLAWIRQNSLEDSFMRGSERLDAAGVEIEDLAKALFIPPKKPYLEPKKEAEASKIATSGEAGQRLMTLQEYHAGRGKDWKAEIRQQLAEDKFEAELRAEMGIAPAGPREEFVASVEVEDEDGNPIEQGDEQQAVSRESAQDVAAKLNGYGTGVRAGVLTPQKDDEKHWRGRLGMPVMGSEAKAKWEEEGVMRPITITPAPRDEPGAAEGDLPKDEGKSVNRINGNRNGSLVRA